MAEDLIFHLKSKSFVKEHIESCDICSNIKYKISYFKITKKSNSNFKTKIHEALLNKKQNP